MVRLFVYWRRISPPTARHLCAFTSSNLTTLYYVYKKIHWTFNYNYVHTNKHYKNKTIKHVCQFKNSTFGIVYNSNKAGTYWYRWPFSLIYQHQFTKTCKQKSTRGGRRTRRTGWTHKTKQNKTRTRTRRANVTLPKRIDNAGSDRSRWLYPNE